MQKNRTDDFTLQQVQFRSGNSVSGMAMNTETSQERSLKALLAFYLRNTAAGSLAQRLLQKDAQEAGENDCFSYPVLSTPGSSRSRSAVLMLHGLNEKRWDKYLPWAESLFRQTGRAVVLFPLAFHMNRAPAEWADPRAMKLIVRERQLLFPDISASSFANAALSHRIQFAPERFLRSGIQSFLDVVQLMAQIRAGDHPCIHPQAQIDLFGYSLGGFLAEMLLMSDPEGYFQQARLFIFCGGSVLNRAIPVSRAIMDSEAAIAMQNFLQELVEQGRTGSSLLENARGVDARTKAVFLSMIHSDRYRSARKRSLGMLNKRIRAVVLMKDRVFPPAAVNETFAGPGIPAKTVDFPYAYSHENPFPLAGAAPAALVSESMNSIFKEAAEHLGG